MNYRISRCLKRLCVSSIALIVFGLILFFVFIAPYRTTPILMYHFISNSALKNSRNILNKDIFKQQIWYLAKHNYKIVHLKELAKMMNEETVILNNLVVVTFDDVNTNFYVQSYPIIKEHKINATLFVSVGDIGKNEDNLNWNQIKQLAKDDFIEIGSHGLSHRILPLLAHQEAREDILLSRLNLEERLKKPVTIFCYPFGAVDNSIKQIVKDAGFQVGVGTAYQRGQFKDDDIYLLKRVSVSGISRYPFVFRFMLSGYYVPTRELILRVLNIKVPRALYNAKK